MPDHMQDSILQAVRHTLRQAATDAGDRVRIEGVDLRGAADTPAIEIEAGDENVSLITQGKGGRGTQQRDFSVEVRAVVATTGADYRAQAVRLHAQIERAIHAATPTTVDALVPGRPRLQAIRAESDGRGAQVVYVMRSIWQCRYFTAEGAPATLAPTP